MGAQKMVSQSGGVQEAKLQSLSRQGSLYSLTLDEVQTQLGDLGKPLGSMNLDELLKSVWTVEANQTTGLHADTNTNMQGSQLASASSLQKQASITFSGDLSKKTVDEVWRDIQHKKSNDQERRTQERHPTLGEMTLEEFLIKAGVATESSHANTNIVSAVDLNVSTQQNIQHNTNWTQYQLPSVQLPQHQHHENILCGFVPGNVVHQPFSVTANTIIETGYSDTMMTMSPSSLMGTSSETQAPGRKRVARGDVVEKTVERRQKRMIKNRESAARSRARKQAYTNELELKVSRLEEENERLRRLRMVLSKQKCRSACKTTSSVHVYKCLHQDRVQVLSKQKCCSSCNTASCVHVCVIKKSS